MDALTKEQFAAEKKRAEIVAFGASRIDAAMREKGKAVS